MKRYLPRINKFIQQQFRKQYVMYLYRPNFVFYKILGFLKKETVFWGHKLCVFKVERFINFFLTNPFFVSKVILPLHLALGLVESFLHREKTAEILSYSMYEQMFTCKNNLVFDMGEKKKQRFKILSRIRDRVEAEKGRLRILKQKMFFSLSQVESNIKKIEKECIIGC